MKFGPYYLPILMYHQILPKSNPHFDKHIAVEPEVFREQVKFLIDNGFTIKTVREYFESRDDRKTAILTFDDVSSSFIEYAKPILDEFGVKASVFPIKNMTLGEKVFNLSADGIKGLSEAELQTLHNDGIELGSHCLSHRNLHNLPFEEAKKELRESKEWLEKVTGDSVATICFPIGGINRDLVEYARELGYVNGLSIFKCALQLEQDRMSLRRVNIKNDVVGKKLKQHLNPLYGFRRFLTRPFRSKYMVSNRHPI